MVTCHDVHCKQNTHNVFENGTARQGIDSGEKKLIVTEKYSPKTVMK